jgi:FtsH-binding integral membrane protein
MIIVGVFTLQDVKLYARDHMELFWIALVVSLVALISLACCPDVRRKTPLNFIFLGMFTLAEGFLLGCVTATYDANEVLMAVGVTAAVVLALTVFAFQTKIDFTAMGGALLAILVVFVLFGLIAAFFPQSRTLNLVYAAIGAIIFSLYIVYDTQIMVGGKHKYSLSPEEYVFGALNLYLDIINLFMYILSIIGNSRN